MGVPAIAIAAVAGLQAAGQISAAQGAARSANYNAKIAQMNAGLETQNAQWAGAEGEQKTQLAGIKAQQDAGNIKVAQSANNVDVNSGSAAQVQRSQAEMAMLNEMNIRSNAARQAYGHETQATSDIAQANLDRSQAKSAKTAGYIGAAGSLLGGASEASMYSNWLGSTGLPDSSFNETSNGFGVMPELGQ